MDEWAWEHVDPWRRSRLQMPVGPFFCVIDGATHGRGCHRPALALNCCAPPQPPGFVDGSLPTSSGMPMRSKWSARVCRYLSSNASSAIMRVILSRERRCVRDG